MNAVNTDQRVATAKRLQAQGLSDSRIIADRVGLSRAAVCKILGRILFVDVAVGRKVKGRSVQSELCEIASFRNVRPR